MYKGWWIATLVVLVSLTGCTTSARRYDGPYSLTQDKTVRTGNVRSQTRTQASSNSYRSRVSAQAVSSSSNKSGNCTYVVQKGDTLYSLAFANNMELSEFAKLNGVRQPYSLYVGQRLNTGSCRASVSGNKATASATAYSSATATATATAYASASSSSSTSYLNRIGAAPSLAPVTPPRTMKYHVVKKGETLYRISKTYNVPVSTLKQLNRLKSNEIEIGQKIALGVVGATPAPAGTVIATHGASSIVGGSSTSTGGTQTTYVAPAVSNTSSIIKNSTPATPVSTVSKPSVQAAKPNGKLAWQWPTVKGKVIQGFSTGEHGNKGIDISDKRGSPVRSAAGGKVVYAGNALRGYGNLIIINHNDDYLSAYAHNDSILVSEGTEVKAGETIARMGDSEASSVRLHFEIRYRGQSVNPMNYLPSR